MIKNSDKVSVQCNLESSYEVVFEKDIFSIDNDFLKTIIGNRQVFVYISPTVEQIYGNKIRGYFDSKVQNVHVLVVPTGENNKNMDTISEIVHFALLNNVDRRCIFIAIGGGILMDMVGFAASITRRKVDYIRIPTTLVGQIDAGIGIKTGANFENKKNFIGAFYAPKLCINDSLFLNTLDYDDVFCGLAEIIKMGIIKDYNLFQKIEDDWNFFNEKNIGNFCEVSHINYLAVVAMLDELEKNFYEEDLERLVDFGHSFSPIIEEKSNFEIPHGYAVAIDMILSTEISYLLGSLPLTSRDRILGLFKQCNYKLKNNKLINSALMFDSLKQVSNHRAGNVNLVIPSEVGEGIFVKKLSDLPTDLMDQAIKNIKEKFDEL